MRRILLFSILIVLFFKLHAQSNIKDLLPVSIKSEGQFEMNFEYDDENRLTFLTCTLVEEHNENSFFLWYKFVYNDNNDLIAMEIANPKEVIFVDNIIYGERKLSLAVKDSIIATYYFDEEGKLINLQQFRKDYTSLIDFEYDMINHLEMRKESHIIKAGKDEEFIINNDIKFQYEDDSRSILWSANYPRWFIMGLEYLNFLDCPKSIEQAVSYDFDEEGKKIVNTSLTYTKNEWGYPVLISFIEDDNEVKEIEIVYKEVN